jgi:antigen flippase
VVYALVRHLTGFRWSGANRQLALLFMPLVALIFAGWYVLPPMGAVILGAVVTVPTGVYSLKTVCTLIPMERLPRIAQRLIRFLRLSPANV